MTDEDLLNFSLDDLAGRGRRAFLLIKGFDQQAVVEQPSFSAKASAGLG